MNVTKIRAVYMAALAQGLGIKEATERANAAFRTQEEKERQLVVEELPSAEEIMAMQVADLRAFLTAEAVTFPGNAGKAKLQAIALDVLKAAAEAGSDAPPADNGGGQGDGDAGQTGAPAATA